MYCFRLQLASAARRHYWQAMHLWLHQQEMRQESNSAGRTLAAFMCPHFYYRDICRRFGNGSGGGTTVLY